jgi:hypothetical protein
MMVRHATQELCNVIPCELSLYATSRGVPYASLELLYLWEVRGQGDAQRCCLLVFKLQRQVKHRPAQQQQLSSKAYIGE